MKAFITNASLFNVYKFIAIKRHIYLVNKVCCSIHLSLDNVEDINKRRFCYLDPLSKIPAIWHVSFVIERNGVIEINGVLSAGIVNNVNIGRDTIAQVHTEAVTKPFI